MRREDVQIWLDRYIAAWSSYEEKAIGDLFAEEAEYRYQPWADPVVGRAAIVADWLENKDEPGTWAAHYDVGRSTASAPTRSARAAIPNPDGSFRTLYYNHFALRFDGHGKCVEFVEYFMELPERLREGR